MGTLPSFIFLIASSLLASVTGLCTDFNFNADDFNREFASANPFSFATLGFRVSTLVNYTASATDTYDFHRYSMGLIAHPVILADLYSSEKNITVLPVDKDTDTHIYSLVRAANPPNITTVDFNETIVMNFTTTVSNEPSISFAGVGFYGYRATFICWNGTLSGCEASDNLEGLYIQASGLQLLDDSQQTLPPGQQQYLGRSRFVDVQFKREYAALTRDISLDPWPTYDELARNATVNQMRDDDGQSGTAMERLSLLMLLIVVSYSVFVNIL